jgi:hypothetical protein
MDPEGSMPGSAILSRTGSDQVVTRDSSPRLDADGSPGMSSAMSRPVQARPFGIQRDPRRRPSVPDLRVCSRPSGSAPAAPSVGRDHCCSRDRSPESVVIPAVLLPERFRAVLRLRRRPRPDSPVGLDASGDYKRGSARFPAGDPPDRRLQSARDPADCTALAQPLVSDSSLRRRNVMPPQSAQGGMRPALTKWVSAPQRSQTRVPGPVISPAW